MSWPRDDKVANSKKAEPTWSWTRPRSATKANLQTFISSNLSECKVGTRGVGVGVDGTGRGSSEEK